MPAAIDVITDALISIGTYSPGEALSDADAEFCLSKLNDMLDSWGTESLTVYAELTQSFPLTPGTTAYTIGPGGTWNGVRPLDIRRDPGRAYVTDYNNNNYPMDVITQEQFNLIGNRLIDSNLPDMMFYDPQYPLGIINIFPSPDISYTVTFICDLALTNFANLYSTFTLPPGYKRAMQTSLALEIWPGFKPDGSSPSPPLLAAASTAKGNIKRKNMKPLKAFFDPEIVSRGYGTYNIKSDTGR